MSKPTSDSLPPMRVDREFSEFLKQTKIDLSKKLNMDAIHIPNPIATKRIVQLAKIGKYYEDNKKIDPVERAMKKLMR